MNIFKDELLQTLCVKTHYQTKNVIYEEWADLSPSAEDLAYHTELEVALVRIDYVIT